MPLVWKGNTTSEAVTNAGDLPFQITFATITNKNAGTTTINVVVMSGSDSVSIVPENLQLSQGDMLEFDSAQVMNAGDQIKITTNASVDYFFTINNIEIP